MNSSSEDTKEQIASLLHDWWVKWWRTQRKGASKTINGYLLLDKKIVDKSQAKATKDYPTLSQEEKDELLEVASKVLELLNI
tara:strand:+ start:143 stop:388 length:246 start_codon:yes stop_codon:yes gene_type:complete